MGILIIIGTTYLGVTVFKRFGASKDQAQVATSVESQNLKDTPHFETILKLGAEERITKMTEGKDGLSILVKERHAGERIIFIDTQTGAIRGVVRIDHKD